MNDLLLLIRHNNEGEMVAKFCETRSGKSSKYMNAVDLFGDIAAFCNGCDDISENVFFGLDAISKIEDDKEFYEDIDSTQNTLSIIQDGQQNEKTIYELMKNSYAVCPYCFVSDFDRGAIAYNITDIEDCVISLLLSFSIYRKTLLKCQRCGRWFSPRSRSDELYCMRLWDGKSCAEIEKRRHMKEAKKERLKDPIQKKLESAYKSLQNSETRLRRAADAVQDTEERERLLKEANKKKQQRSFLTAHKTEHLFSMEDTIAFLENEVRVKSRKDGKR